MLKSDDSQSVPRIVPALLNENLDSEVLKFVNKSLSSELSTVQNSLEIQEAKTDELAAKLSKLSVWNTNK